MSSIFSPLAKSIQSPFPNNSPNFRQSMGQTSQPNSPADSAIGTASESIQSPPLDANTQRMGPTGNMQKSTFSAQINQPSTSESQQSSRPPKKLSRLKNGQISISLPIREKIICERDFERIVKETELLRGTKGTSQEQLMAESKLSREWLNEPNKGTNNNNNDRVEESRKHYYFDPIRHEYRLYYSREVRLRSETNLAAIGLDIELRGLKERNENEGKIINPLRRRHSAGAGHLRRAVPPPKNAFSNGNGGNGIGQLVQQNATKFPATGNDQLEKVEEAKVNVLEFSGEKQFNAEKGPKTMRRGAFERNSTSRKPFQLRSVSDPPRRRQWSGGAKRAALKQQQELLEQQKRMGTELGIEQGKMDRRPIPAIRQNQIVPKTMEKTEIGEKERFGNENWQKSLNGIGGNDEKIITTPPTVTNQMLKQLLRPLQKNEDFGWHSDEQNINKWATGREYDKEALLGHHSQQKQQMMAIDIDKDNSADGKKGKKGSRSIWNCFRMKRKTKKEENGKKRRKTLPESSRPPNDRLQRYMAYLLVPLFLLVAVAAIAIVVTIWYI